MIGKANRIGVKLNGGMRSTPPGAQNSPPQPRGPWGRNRAGGLEGARRGRPGGVVVAWGEGATGRGRSRQAVGFRDKLRADRRIFAAAEVGEMRRIGLVEIGEFECRWPLGDPSQDDFAYCGLEIAKGRPYCAGHCRLVYRVPNA